MTLTVPRPLRVALFALACAVVAWASLTPVQALPTVDLWDKAEHAAAYLGLALLGAWSFRAAPVLAGLILFGIGVEVLQAVMGLGRQGDALDAVANTLGVVAGLVLATAARRLRR